MCLSERVDPMRCHRDRNAYQAPGDERSDSGLDAACAPAFRQAVFVFVDGAVSSTHGVSSRII